MQRAAYIEARIIEPNRNERTHRAYWEASCRSAGRQ